ncbi:hypothetical protein ACFWOX_33940 [Streptomyces sp. NPDC058467]|uniref:hypothetical protein n=1 Tax=Streptomyces sp. NPDC058467 TaxID=3346513 RepID=UPI00364617AC
MSSTRDAERDQPLPTPGQQSVQDALIGAVQERRAYGIRKYGRPLETHNGRDALTDAWEEALDLVTYLTQMRLERGDQLPAAVPSATTDRTDVAAVRALHQPMQRGPFTICAHCSGWDGEWRCLGVVTNYPCPTLRALNDAAAGSAVAGHTGDETGRETLAAALDGLHTLIATSSRDWQTYRVDAWIWAVLCGWDCEQDEHDDTCTHGALEETAAMHGWDADTVTKARRYRAAVRALTEPAAGLPAGGAPHTKEA